MDRSVGIANKSVAAQTQKAFPQKARRWAPPANGEENLLQEPTYDVSDSAPVAYESIPTHLLTPLTTSWCLWYTNATAKNAENFENCLIPVGIVSTAEAFWALYSHCIRPSALQKGTDYFLFREGVRPMWEDPANAQGGTLMVRLRKNTLDYLWENLILAMMADQLGPGIVGAVASKRYTVGN